MLKNSILHPTPEEIIRYLVSVTRITKLSNDFNEVLWVDRTATKLLNLERHHLWRQCHTVWLKATTFVTI